MITCRVLSLQWTPAVGMDHVMSHDNHMIWVARVMVSNLLHNAYFKHLTGKYTSCHGDLVKCW